MIEGLTYREVELLRALCVTATYTDDEPARQEHTRLAAKLSNDLTARKARGDDLLLSLVTTEPVPKCTCGKTLDANGEHEGGYGAFCG